MNQQIKNSNGPRNRPRNRQSGAALIVALVMLLVLTVLGVSTMSTATMEMRMAANDRFYENAFQLSETGLDIILSGLNSGAIPEPPITTENTCFAPSASTFVATLNGTFQTTLCFFRGETAILPAGGGAGSTIGKIAHYHFQNNSQGIVPGPGASSFNSMGMFKEGPLGEGS